MFCFPNRGLRELNPLSSHNLCVDMHVNETKFEGNSSLGYYHMTCYWENKTYELKRSILLWVLAKMIVIVTEASYQMLQVLSFCDTKRA